VENTIQRQTKQFSQEIEDGNRKIIALQDQLEQQKIEFSIQSQLSFKKHSLQLKEFQAAFKQEKDVLEQKILSLQNQIKELNDELERKERLVVDMKKSVTDPTTPLIEQPGPPPPPQQQSSPLGGLNWLGFIGGSPQQNDTTTRDENITKENNRLKKLLHEKNTNALALQNENSLLSKENVKLKSETLKLKQFIKQHQKQPHSAQQPSDQHQKQAQQKPQPTSESSSSS